MVCCCESESRSVMSDSLWPHGPYNPWKSPGQNTGVGSRSLRQRIFPTQGLNPGLPHCRWVLYQLSHQGCPCCWEAILKSPFHAFQDILSNLTKNSLLIPHCVCHMYFPILSEQREKWNIQMVRHLSLKGKTFWDEILVPWLADARDATYF